MKHHSYRRRIVAATMTVGAVSAMVAGCGSDSSSGSTASSAVNESALGSQNVASGAPVTLGYIGDGRTQTLDDTNGAKAASAAVDYANNYLGGINGHKIVLKTCQSEGIPGNATDCANQMVSAKVAAVVEPSYSYVDQTIDVLAPAKIPMVLHLPLTAKTLQTSGVFSMANGFAAGYGSPAVLAKQDGVKQASIITMDIPAVAASANSIGKLAFGNMGVNTSVTLVPPGTPDATPQVTAATQSNPGLITVVGESNFCTGVLKAVRTVAPNAKVSIMDRCIAPGASAQIPNGYQGMKVGVTANLDKSTSDAQVFTAAMAKYGDGADADVVGAYGWAPMLGLIKILNAAKVTDLTPAGVTTAIQTAPPVEYPLTNGIMVQCNGKAIALSPNICSADGIVANADQDGNLSDYQIVKAPDGLYTPPKS